MDRRKELQLSGKFYRHRGQIIRHGVTGNGIEISVSIHPYPYLHRCASHLSVLALFVFI